MAIQEGNAMNPLAIIAAVKINLLHRPLWHTQTAQEVLDINRLKMAEMIQSGQFPWVFNIGTGKHEAEIRLLAHSAVEMQLGILPQIGATKNLKLPEVIDLCVPVKREVVRGTEIQRWWNCGPSLVQLLAETGELERLAGTHPKTGPNASPRLTRSSLVKFLSKRRVT
jgi:hypothetical protein